MAALYSPCHCTWGGLMYRSTRFQAIVILAVGLLLGYGAASGWFVGRTAEASPSTVPKVETRPALAKPASPPAGAVCCDEVARGDLVAFGNRGQKEPAAGGKKPNILVIMGDDIGWFNVGAYHQGIMSGKTPNLDKLAAQGMRFTDYYAEASCTAGRAAFITGEIPLRTGLTTVGQAGADVG